MSATYATYAHAALGFLFYAAAMQDRATTQAVWCLVIFAFLAFWRAVENYAAPATDLSHD